MAGLPDPIARFVESGPLVGGMRVAVGLIESEEGEVVRKQRAVRYAVVGLGYFVQAAVLPAFARLKNSQLTALISGDTKKLAKLGKRYGVKHRLGYAEYDEFLQSGEVDAVYIVLPNHLHAEYAVRASQAQKHVLCEKPMAVTEEECLRMMAASREAGAKLMIAYRLHFESATLALIDAIRAGKLGEPRLFDAAFSMQVSEGNVRLRRSTLGGGPLYDIGIYCINAARYVFQDEPTEVTAFTARRQDDARFREVEEQVAAVLRFPNERLATFTAGFGAVDVSRFQVVRGIPRAGRSPDGFRRLQRRRRDTDQSRRTVPALAEVLPISSV